MDRVSERLADEKEIKINLVKFSEVMINDEEISSK